MCRDLAPILVTWGLRDYGIEGQVWDEIPDNCYECPQHNNGPCTICHCLGKEHVWGDELPGKPEAKHSEAVHKEGFKDAFRNSDKYIDHKLDSHTSQGQFCQHCNAWKGSLGLEPTPELFISHLVQVFRGVWRVLHKSGTIWVNMGDNYANSSSGGGGPVDIRTDGRNTSPGDKVRGRKQGVNTMSHGLKPKDLCGIPWRVALALQADGWYLRSGLPWVKRSAMPESCTDRPASALEYMFLLSKSQHYFFDSNAIRIPHKYPNDTNRIKGKSKSITMGQKLVCDFDYKMRVLNPAGRNYRNTDLFYESITPPHGMIFCGDEPVGLDVNPQAMKEAHFATFPEKLVEPCLKAGTSEKGCCPECLAPWERVVEKGELKSTCSRGDRADFKIKQDETGLINEGLGRHPGQAYESKTIGWKQNCNCKAGEPIPCTVMDIFGGSGTVAVVAEKHRRNWILVELSSDYCELSKDRIQQATKQRRLF